VSHAKTVCGDIWLLEYKGTQRYTSIKNISREFSGATGDIPFKELRMYYHAHKKQKKPEVVPVPKKVSVCLREEATVDPVAICENMDIANSSKRVYVGNVMQLQRVVLGEHTKFRMSKFCTQEVYDKVEKHITEISPNVACNEMVALCRILETGKAPAEYCVKYHNLVNICNQRASLMPRKATRDFMEILGEIKRVYESHKTSVSLRVIMLVVMHSIMGTEFDIGVLRLHDFINTKLRYDDQYSYIDLDQREWYIRKECTKNKDERIIKLSGEFVDQLGELYADIPTEWMVFMERDKDNRRIPPKKYNTTDSLTEMVERRLGCSITEIRASYVSYIHKENVFPIDKCIKLAKNMGHRHITAMDDYIRKIYCEGEGE
jgi:hypothetical protein